MRRRQRVADKTGDLGKVQEYTVLMDKGQGYIQGDNNKDNCYCDGNLDICAKYFDLVYRRNSSSTPVGRLRGKKGTRSMNNHWLIEIM
jgi:hypothetical protein